MKTLNLSRLSLLLAGVLLAFTSSCSKDESDAGKKEGLKTTSVDLGQGGGNHESHEGHEGHEGMKDKDMDHGGMKDMDHAKGEGHDEHATAKRVEVEVLASGYQPSMVMAKAGEPITIVFKRTTDQGCGQVVMIPSAGIKKDLPLNEPVEVTFTPKSSGNLEFTCGMKMMKGTIMVH